MISFKLFQDNQPINDVKILTASNDINRLLAETEFALFPMKSLEFDKDYRVEFAYRQNNQDKIEKWQFHTRKKRIFLNFNLVNKFGKIFFLGSLKNQIAQK